MSSQVGILINRKSYPASEYIEAMLITAGVTAFHLTEHKTGPHYQEEHQDSMFGIFLLCLYLACDSFTSQVTSINININSFLNETFPYNLSGKVKCTRHMEWTSSR